MTITLPKIQAAIALTILCLASTMASAQMGMPSPDYWTAMTACFEMETAKRDRDMAYGYMSVVMAAARAIPDQAMIEKTAGDALSASAQVGALQGDWYLMHSYFTQATSKYISATIDYAAAAICYRRAAQIVIMRNAT